MGEFDLRGLQMKGLETVLYFKDFCDKNNLLFYLSGGCCIGALRYGGFIPWDDDVDVYMPRKDYERLKAIWNDNADIEKYPMVCSNENLVDGNLFLTVRNANTTFIKPYQKNLDIPQGVCLDVFPLDGCPDDLKARKKQLFWALVYFLYAVQAIPKNHGVIKKIGSAVLLGLVPFKKWRYKLWRYAEREMTKYDFDKCENIREMCSGPVYMKNIYPKKCFTSATELDFEGYRLPFPVGYDEYLKIAFGDYMTPPPPEKQIPQHEAIFMDLENGYKKYKGIYYCVGSCKRGGVK